MKKALASLPRLVREHPVEVGVFVVFIAIGVIGALLLPLGLDAMSTPRRIAAGAVAGAGAAMFPIVHRLYD